MRPRFLLGIVACASAACAAVTACSSNSSGTAPADAGAADAADAAIGPDGSSSGGPLPDGGDPSFDDFEDPGGCGGWQGDGAEVQWHPGGASGSLGSCQVCVVDAGGVLYKLVPLAPGGYQLDAYLSQLDGGVADASTWSAAMNFQNGDNSPAGAFSTNGALTPSWAAIPPLRGTTPTGNRVYVTFGVSNDCFLVDSIRVSKH